MAYTEAQKRADQNYAKKHREHRNYLSKRSNCRSFIRNLATLEDLTQIKTLVKERESNLNTPAPRF